MTLARAAGTREVLLVSLGAAMSAVPITVATRGGLRPGIDLAVYLEAGRAVVHGWPLYSPDFGHDLSTPLPYTYPPGAAALVAAVAWIPQLVWFVALSLASLVVLGWLVVDSFDDAIARLSPGRPALAWVIVGVWAGAMAPVDSSLWLGQVSILLVAGVYASSLAALHRDRGGGLTGLFCGLKVTPGVFLLLYAGERRWRSLGRAALSLGAVTLLGLVVRPAESVRYFRELLWDGSRVGGLGSYLNQSLLGAFTRAGDVCLS